MKVCKCGYRFSDDERVCPICEDSIENAHEEQEGSPFSVLGNNGMDTQTKSEEQAAVPSSDTVKESDKEQSAPSGETVSPHANEEGAAPIFSLFEADKAPKKDAPKVQVKKPERPKPGPNVEIQQVANASKEAKFDPMKTPPPVDSRFSLLNTGSSAFRIFILLIPVVGFIYALILTLGASKKENVRTLGTAFLIAYMIQLVIIAAAMLVLALLFEVKFNQLIEIIKYTFDTFFSLIKSM